MARQVLLLVVLTAAAVAVAVAAPRNRRLTEDEALTPLDRSNSTSKIICNADTSCGWTVYTPFTKDIDYYMKNNYCDCAPGTVCSYYDDDISIGSYVHRCQVPLSSTKPPTPAAAAGTS